MDKYQKEKMTEYFCALAVIAFGEYNGNAFEITPKLPTIFTNGIHIESERVTIPNADFLRIETSDNGLVCWFVDEDDEMFFLTFQSLLSYAPLLYAALVTYLFDAINNGNANKC